MEDFVTNINVMEDYINKYNYLVVKPDYSVELYRSLRKIADDISLDPSTISKKLKEENGCLCSSKPEGYVFYIKKLT